VRVGSNFSNRHRRLLLKQDGLRCRNFHDQPTPGQVVLKSSTGTGRFCGIGTAGTKRAGRTGKALTVSVLFVVG